jgi:hypothetical protein
MWIGTMSPSSKEFCFCWQRRQRRGILVELVAIGVRSSCGVNFEYELVGTGLDMIGNSTNPYFPQEV